MATFFQKLAYKLYAMKAAAATGIPLVFNTKPDWSDWNLKNANAYGYAASTWVYSCINKKAKAAASVPWYAYKVNSDGEYERVKNHPFEQLLAKPNPFTSRNKFIERLVVQLELGGNSIHQKVKVGNTPVELWNIGPDGIRPVPDQREFIKSYEYKQGNKTHEIPPDEIMHHMYIDPGNVYWGIGPLQVAAKTVDTDVEAVSWNKVALQNRAVTDGVFSFDHPLTQEQWTAARQQVADQHQGSKNARAPWVLGSGARWNQMSLSPAEMDFINSRRMTREEICGTFSVPPPLVGILDKANYATMKEARRVFWLDTIIPLLDDLQDSFNQSLAHEFGEGIEIGYDVSNVEAIQDNFNEKIDAAHKIWTMGIPFNEVNQRLDLGFDEVEGGDTGYLPTSLLPATIAGSLNFNNEMTNQPNDPPDQDLLADGSTDNEVPKSHPGPDTVKGFNLKTTEQKAIYWKNFESQRLPWYNSVQNQARKMFDQERKAIVKAFKKNGEAAALKAVDKRKWNAFYFATLSEIAKEFGKRRYDNIKGFTPGATKEFDPFDELAMTWIEAAAADKVTYVTDYTKQLIKGIVADGQEEDKTVDEIAEEIDLTFEEFSEHRSFRIARTEVAGASNFGSHWGALQASDELGTEMTKEWVDSADDRVREAHEDMDGEKRKMTEPYSNGLMYPGDMNSGKAKDVVHCRCVEVYHLN